jgi:uncharacterized protein with FMN-binding domain
MPDKQRMWGRLAICPTILVLFLGGLAAQPAFADTLELLSGAKVQGKVAARDSESITFNSTVGGRDLTRKYPLDRVHAVTVGDKREVLHEMPAGGKSSPSAKSPARPDAAGTGTAGTTDRSSGVQRTQAEIEALIDKLGKSPPDWWDSVPLNYPQTLDLSWPIGAPPGGWNSQKNVGQYIWDVINPNPNKWREGIRFIHHLLTLHKDDPEKRVRAMETMARMYQSLLQDYARAAFWWRSAGVDKGEESTGSTRIELAECYWKLGSKQMAQALLKRCPLRFDTIKLLGDMGDTRHALELVDASTRSSSSADVACIYAGDVCRTAGDYPKALKYYQQVLAVPATGQAQKRIERNQQRARENIEGIKLFDSLDLRRVPDGKYQSSSLGYQAAVQVEVAVKGGRIESVRVTGHQEKQFYSSLTDTPARIIAKQSVKGVDTTSRATMTSEAIINATAKALSGGMK